MTGAGRMEVELGWRRRAVALAALGAAVLQRSAFVAFRTGGLEPIEMQSLIFLTLAEEHRLESQAGEVVERLARALAADPEDVAVAVASLARLGLVGAPEFAEEDRVEVTADGVAAVEEWVELAASLFERWPPEVPGVDDATG